MRRQDTPVTAMSVVVTGWPVSQAVVVPAPGLAFLRAQPVRPVPVVPAVPGVAPASVWLERHH